MIFGQSDTDRKMRSFTLTPAFVDQFKGKQPEWGYGGLGLFVCKRTYARELIDGSTEEFWQTCQRVVEGCFNIQKMHCRQMGLPWKDDKARNSAQDMFQRMWDFKFSPPGRGLWVMGTDLVFEKGSAALQSCGFHSTENIGEDFSGPFTFLMDMSMLGVGIGGDTRGAGKVRLGVPKTTLEPFVVADSREGWVDLLRNVLCSFVGKTHFPLVIDYSKIRCRGTPIKTFGGIASGPKPLQEMIENITRLLLPNSMTVTWDVDWRDDQGRIELAKAGFSGTGGTYKISSTQIVDLFNYIGKAVVAGGIRRSSEIMFGDVEDPAFMTLKQDKAALDDRRWVSNNSIFAKVGMDYSEVAKSMAINGEPGLIWLDNMRAYSRMCDVPDYKDRRAMGTNPCFTGDTLIAVADGRGAVSIKELVKQGEDVPVYSISKENEIEIQWARHPRCTREMSPLVKVLLKDNTFIRVTPDHKMRLLDGTTCEAKDLMPGNILPKLDPKASEDSACIKEVQILEVQEPVYNLTVDKNHTVGVVTKCDITNGYCGVFTPQCSEQTLEDKELCNLVECYPAHHDTYEDFEKTLKMAYLYAKTVTLIPTHDQRSNAVMMRNRRIGCSMSGVTQAIKKFGRRKFLNWCDQGYQYILKMDKVYSDWFGIPLSIKVTAIKPGGTTPLLCGSTPGVHYPHSEYYIRNVRVANTSPLVEACIKAGYPVDPDVYADDTSVVGFPVHEKHFTKGKDQVSIWEQFALVADMQDHWTDNQVSATITVKKHEVADIKSCLEVYETRLKGISLLPAGDEDHGYAFPPYQAITKDQYESMVARITPLDFGTKTHDASTEEKFCTGDTCMLKLAIPDPAA